MNENPERTERFTPREPDDRPEKTPETRREPAPGVEHEPEPDAENIMPAEDRPGTL